MAPQPVTTSSTDDPWLVLRRKQEEELSEHSRDFARGKSELQRRIDRSKLDLSERFRAKKTDILARHKREEEALSTRLNSKDKATSASNPSAKKVDKPSVPPPKRSSTVPVAKNAAQQQPPKSSPVASSSKAASQRVKPVRPKPPLVKPTQTHPAQKKTAASEVIDLCSDSDISSKTPTHSAAPLREPHTPSDNATNSTQGTTTPTFSAQTPATSESGILHAPRAFPIPSADLVLFGDKPMRQWTTPEQWRPQSQAGLKREESSSAFEYPAFTSSRLRQDTAVPGLPVSFGVKTDDGFTRSTITGPMAKLPSGEDNSFIPGHERNKKSFSHGDIRAGQEQSLVPTSSGSVDNGDKDGDVQMQDVSQGVTPSSTIPFTDAPRTPTPITTRPPRPYFPTPSPSRISASERNTPNANGFKKPSVPASACKDTTTAATAAAAAHHRDIRGSPNTSTSSFTNPTSPCTPHSQRDTSFTASPTLTPTSSARKRARSIDVSSDDSYEEQEYDDDSQSDFAPSDNDIEEEEFRLHGDRQKSGGKKTKTTKTRTPAPVAKKVKTGTRPVSRAKRSSASAVFPSLTVPLANGTDRLGFRPVGKHSGARSGGGGSAASASTAKTSLPPPLSRSKGSKSTTSSATRPPTNTSSTKQKQISNASSSPSASQTGSPFAQRKAKLLADEKIHKLNCSSDEDFWTRESIIEEAEEQEQGQEQQDKLTRRDESVDEEGVEGVTSPLREMSITPGPIPVRAPTPTPYTSSYTPSTSAHSSTPSIRDNYVDMSTSTINDIKNDTASFFQQWTHARVHGDRYLAAQKQSLAAHAPDTAVRSRQPTCRTESDEEDLDANYEYDITKDEKWRVRR